MRFRSPPAGDGVHLGAGGVLIRLFCSGHAQLPDRRIMLAGGTLAYSTPTTNYKGMARS
ncbi:hypothetical protein ThrDRAFT_02693 [Frankia casuarinae]|uniref:hypothetical protein n=1 Tax=Frankia TaxID=1854 RepID=UPI0003129B8B|nr:MULTISPECIES: hypothetical protein [Frankia]ETA01436.1 hypothetical protein CcI6DRAFT_03178 [Frankia sp. CcI6]EYT91688.1 hypothetical protein ThrDRAFT_02693 [Frankia casuarinae]KDA41997.1 hypothetical protein BMG523Draft_03204 [Frankia sp. BMG5.23]KFB05505.1 hypothetical protein ALLO2DRAFT_01745 [Frankia sp. Allo2]